MNYDELYYASHLLDPIKDQPQVKVRLSTMRSIHSDEADRLNTLFFRNRDVVFLSRKDIFSIRRRDQDLFMISVLYWGYPTNNRQRCTYAMESWLQLSELVTIIRSHRYMALDYYTGLEQNMAEIYNLNISTFSKLFYFAKASIEGHGCLILDNSVIAGINALNGDVFLDLQHSISGANRYHVYPMYLAAMAYLSDLIGVPAQNLEYVLWLAGKKHL